MKNEKDILRIVTSGNVDDGKSTLIGQLLIGTNSVPKDILMSLQREGHLDPADLLDGLSIEQEQGITIDVSHQYFENDSRKFIIYDCPGHLQYTRNMITGASFADLGILLIDSTKGIREQTMRHANILAMLNKKMIIIAINKLDLIDEVEKTFNQIKSDFLHHKMLRNIPEIHFIPISARENINIIKNQNHYPWYKGNALLELVTNYNHSKVSNEGLRVPIQYVSKNSSNKRFYYGEILNGNISVGDQVIIFPEGTTSAVESLYISGQKATHANSRQAIAISLKDELDISRGSMLSSVEDCPFVNETFHCNLFWISKHDSNQFTQLKLKHTSRLTNAYIEKIEDIIDFSTNQSQKNLRSHLQRNEIASCVISVTNPIFFDQFDKNPLTGAFLLIDSGTSETVAFGTITSQTAYSQNTQKVSPNTRLEKDILSIDDFRKLSGQNNQVLWLTGLSASGKSTLAIFIQKVLFDKGINAVILDGDNLRHGLNGDLGFTKEERKENLRRAMNVAKLFYQQGIFVICSFISPFSSDRDAARSLFPVNDFHEIYVNTPLEDCISRDPKGLYKKALTGEIPNLTGINAPYETPKNPELILVNSDTKKDVVQETLERYINKLLK